MQGRTRSLPGRRIPTSVDNGGETRPLKPGGNVGQQPLSKTIVYKPVERPHSAAFTRTTMATRPSSTIMVGGAGPPPASRPASPSAVLGALCTSVYDPEARPLTSLPSVVFSAGGVTRKCNRLSTLFPCSLPLSCGQHRRRVSAKSAETSGDKPGCPRGGITTMQQVERASARRRTSESCPTHQQVGGSSQGR